MIETFAWERRKPSIVKANGYACLYSAREIGLRNAADCPISNNTSRVSDNYFYFIHDLLSWIGIIMI